jgi:general secretion pathway protein I
MRRGFTLLEVLVATVLMAIAVTGLLSNLRTSISNAARLSDLDKVTILARRQMDALLMQKEMPRGIVLSGVFPPELTGGLEAGWRAQRAPFEALTPPGVPVNPGQFIVERIRLVVWWGPADKRRTLALETYRNSIATPEDARAVTMGPAQGGVF